MVEAAMRDLQLAGESEEGVGLAVHVHLMAYLETKECPVL
jgi:hypothetical protein